MTRAELDVSDRLARVRDLNAHELGIDPTLIASKATLFALGRHDPEAWADLMPWQRELLEKPPAKRPTATPQSLPPRAGAQGPETPRDVAQDDDDRSTPVYGLD
jgi:hypothetical protein